MRGMERRALGGSRQTKEESGRKEMVVPHWRQGEGRSREGVKTKTVEGT